MPAGLHLLITDLPRLRFMRRMMPEFRFTCGWTKLGREIRVPGLTAWELGQHGVPHTVVADNVGGHLMQQGMVDLVITGTDRTTFTGDVANKIGTYLKALAADDNGIPFCVALPSSTFDWEIRDGVNGIPIEQRGGDEVTVMSGVPVDRSGPEQEFQIVAEG